VTFSIDGIPVVSARKDVSSLTSDLIKKVQKLKINNTRRNSKLCLLTFSLMPQMVMFWNTNIKGRKFQQWTT